PVPRRPAYRGERGNHRQGNDEVAVLRPPGLEFGYLFLLFEIVDRHHQASSSGCSEYSTPAIASGSASSVTRCWAPPPHSGLRPTSPAAASSSPITIATGASLASAFFICDLKLPPPQCISTAKPCSRSDSAARMPRRWAASPTLTT